MPGYIERVKSHIYNSPLDFIRSFFSTDAWGLFYSELTNGMYRRRADHLLRSQGKINDNQHFSDYMIGPLLQKARENQDGWAAETFTDNSWAPAAWIVPQVPLMSITKGPLYYQTAKLDTGGCRSAFNLVTNLLNVNYNFVSRELRPHERKEKLAVKEVLVGNRALEDVWNISAKQLARLVDSYNQDQSLVHQLKQYGYEVMAELCFGYDNLPKDFHQMAEQFDINWQCGDNFNGFEHWQLKQRFLAVSESIHQHLDEMAEDHPAKGLLEFLVKHHGFSSKNAINVSGFLAIFGNLPNAIFSAVGYVIANPAMQSSLQTAIEEAKQWIAEHPDDKPVTAISKNSDLLLNQLIEEILRVSDITGKLPRINGNLFSALPIGNTGVSIPPLGCSIVYTSQWEKLDQPEIFKPRPSYRTNVFGEGPRTCMGQHLARRALISLLMQSEQYDWQITQGAELSRKLLPPEQAPHSYYDCDIRGNITVKNTNTFTPKRDGQQVQLLEVMKSNEAFQDTISETEVKDYRPSLKHTS